ncbi:uncharacterized protein EV154DRAFT_46104 [Mucor mucedo]|uniref:uncharacterized protein n=1 Tax=Mucor mucedo TaxID=29922 RepID=UPI002221110C|nr:uncharacterized protein EV154DRAFT_46104 [Mucor mucedo]KAI7880268.1 hypothetical protein EV154DRAFT_46104 [Mucor mucedo]
MFPLPIPKSIASQLNNSSTAIIETQDEPNFFCKPKILMNLFDFNTRKITSCPIVFNCKMDRGFFTSQSHWTCYRRNYFQVTASFIIQGHSEGTCYALQFLEKLQPIGQFFLRLKACTSSAEPDPHNNIIRPVALTQMTPKRDKGPQREPPVIPIAPSDTMYGSEQVCVTFERLQFRVATANNGKRRASQQYFHLIFDLIAQLEDGSQHTIAECYSSPLVVRGRSPGHYSLEPQQHQHQQRTSNSKKRKPSASPPSSSHTSNNEEEDVKKEDDKVTLPPPQYVFSSPPMVMEQPNYMINTSFNNNNNTNNNNSSAFSNFHHRSQSANDSHFFARHRPGLKYQPMMVEQGGPDMFDPYEVGMARALGNWQQVQHGRTDSYESYDNSNRGSTRPGTPVPYNYPPQPSAWSNNGNHHFMDAQENTSKLNQHDNKLYNNNNSN